MASTRKNRSSKNGTGEKTTPTPKKPVPTSTRRAATEKARAAAPRKPASPPGPFGKTLLANLQRSPAGTPDWTVLLRTLKAIPQAELKKALAAARPIEKALLFSQLPADQIVAQLKALPGEFLAPAAPPAPPPAPAGGPPASILMTTYQNVPFQPALDDPLWSMTFTGGQTIGYDSKLPWEWMSVYDQSAEREGSLNNPLAGVTGWAVRGDPRISSNDVWFVHPFGNDFQFFVAVDPQYDMLLGSSNTGTNPKTGEVDDDFAEANAVAGTAGTTARDDGSHRPGLGLPVPKGVLGVEIEHLQVPPTFQDAINDGTRVAVFGRWIVDCGHDDFHTEIHPPLLMAAANVAPPPAGRPNAIGQRTSVQLVSRPFTVSQDFGDGNFVQHLIDELVKVESTYLGIPSSWRVEAHPHVFPTPYQGRPFVKLLIQPPPVPHHGPVTVPTPRRLMVSCHFTCRNGVVVQPFDAGNGTLGLIIVFGDLSPATLPENVGQTIQWSQLGKDYEKIIKLIEAGNIASQLLGTFLLGLGGALSDWVLSRGILTDLYDAPPYSSPADFQNVVTAVPIEALPNTGTAGVAYDDGQPFPIRGTVDVWWETVPPIFE